MTLALSGVSPSPSCRSTAPVRTGEIIREILSSNEKGLHFEVRELHWLACRMTCAVLQRTLVTVAFSSA